MTTSTLIPRYASYMHLVHLALCHCSFGWGLTDYLITWGGPGWL